MNLLELEIERKAAIQAKKLLKNAIANEPEITADLQKIISPMPVEMVGLENKFKTKESLTKKIYEKSLHYFEHLIDLGTERLQAINEAVSRTAKNNNDVLRYTLIIPSERYTFYFKIIINELEKMDYKIPPNKIWNAWKIAATKYDTGYRGINITVISSQSLMFELQFHTRESFQLKMQTHGLYKEATSIETVTHVKRRIIQTMIEAAKNVSIPRGAKEL
jgi:hypothetical protein